MFYNIIKESSTKDLWFSKSAEEAKHNNIFANLEAHFKANLNNKNIPNYYKRIFTDTVVDLNLCLTCSINNMPFTTNILESDIFVKSAQSLWKKYDSYKITESFEQMLVLLKQVKFNTMDRVVPLNMISNSNDPISIFDNMLKEIIANKEHLESKGNTLNILEQRQLIYYILYTHELKSLWLCNNMQDMNNMQQMSNCIFNLSIYCLDSVEKKGDDSIIEDLLANLNLITI